MFTCQAPSRIQPPIPSFTARPFQRELAPTSPPSSLSTAEPGVSSPAIMAPPSRYGGEDNHHLNSWLLHHQQLPQQGLEGGLPWHQHQYHLNYSYAGHSAGRSHRPSFPIG